MNSRGLDEVRQYMTQQQQQPSGMGSNGVYGPLMGSSALPSGPLLPARKKKEVKTKGIKKLTSFDLQGIKGRLKER